ncbi:MAG: MFS transporter [Cardiobacteriaceae bacterium]|nr:MFS transporter [Cardiobacteriaceae bacterium]
MTAPFRHLTPIMAFTISLIGIMAFLQVHSVQSILPLLYQYYSATEIEIGLAAGGSILAMGLLSPFIGMLSDAYGRASFIRYSVLLISIPIYFSSFAPTIFIFTLLRFAVGLFVPAMTVCLIAYIAEEFKGQNLAKLMSLYVASSVFGGFAGRFLLGYFSEYFSWQIAMQILAGINLVCAIWVFFVLPKSRRFTPNSNFLHSFSILRSHLTNKSVISSCALGFCILFCLISCFSFINLRLSGAPYNLNTAHLANIFAVYLIGMLITPLTATALRRLGVVKTMIISLSFSSLGIFLTLIPYLWIIIFGLALMCSGIFVAQSATMSHIAINIKQGRSLATGLYYLSYYGGGFIGAWICGATYKYWQWNGVVITMFIVLFLAMTNILLFIKSDA